LRLLLQGANPKKYGRTGGGVKPAKSPRVASNAEVREALASRLWAFRDRVRAESKAREAGSERACTAPGTDATPTQPSPIKGEG
jgi:hypothetical protein